MKPVLTVLAVILAVLGLAALALRVPDTDPAAMRAKYAAAPSQFVTLGNGLVVHLRDEGPRDAPAIILLHGSNADLHTWQKWAEKLRTRYRVIRYDQRGHGLTGPAPDADYRTEAFAGDVGEVADRLGLAQFHLAGNSMGGAIAARFAMDRPERLSSLVLVDAGGAPVRREGGGNLAFKLAAMPVLGEALSAFMPRALVARSLSQSVANQAIVTDAAIDRYWELARYPGNRKATSQRFAIGWQVYSADEVARIESPTLVMWGEEDSLIPFAAGKWYARTLPRARLVSYPGIGHIPMEEAPERSAADLMAWLAERAGPAAPEAS